MDDYTGIIEFLELAERLKSSPRSAWTSSGDRETVAAHTWRLCLLALVVGERFPEVNLDRVIQILLVHDLGEALHGDIPAPRQDPANPKSADERRDLVQVIAPLSATVQARLLDLWDEYDAFQTPEARLARGLDKLETILQHVQGANPADFDYEFNLGYGRKFTEGDARLEAFREVLDAMTAARARNRPGPDDSTRSAGPSYTE